MLHKVAHGPNRMSHATNKVCVNISKGLQVSSEQCVLV